MYKKPIEEICDILDSTIFQRFSLKSDNAKKMYAERLRNCTNLTILKKACWKLVDDSRSLPTISEIKSCYKDFCGVKQSDVDRILGKQKPTELDKQSKIIFFEIWSNLKTSGKSYNQYCYDKGYFDFLDNKLKKPNFTNENFDHEMFVKLCK